MEHIKWHTQKIGDVLVVMRRIFKKWKCVKNLVAKHSKISKKRSITYRKKLLLQKLKRNMV